MRTKIIHIANTCSAKHMATSLQNNAFLHHIHTLFKLKWCKVYNRTFVTKKITRAVVEIVAGKRDKLLLGNLDARRDWGYAPEYVEAMWLMMQHLVPDDFVIATGEDHSVREFLDEAFGYVNMDWKPYVGIDHRYFRPAEVDLLVGDAFKAKRMLGWKAKTKFRELVKIMVEAELAKI